MASYFYIALPLVIGYLLDLIFGDPRKFPHPIRWYGWLIYKLEPKLNNGVLRRLKGLLFVIVLVLGVYILLYFLVSFSQQISIVYYTLVSILVFYGLANKSLIQEGQAVISCLNSDGLEAGRKRLSWIVGRDTASLTDSQVRIAVLETLSENLSDGVIAPLFYYAILGVPGMMAYKMINTLDSMVGYKSEKYKEFGWAAAKLDDLVNFIPARLTAVLIALVNVSWRAIVFIFQYGHKHASPNSGYPEAALAGVLNCRFGGPNLYKGVLVDKPYIGNVEREIDNSDMNVTIYTNHIVTLVVVFLILVIQYLFTL